MLITTHVVQKFADQLFKDDSTLSIGNFIATFEHGLIAARGDADILIPQKPRRQDGYRAVSRKSELVFNFQGCYCLVALRIKAYVLDAAHNNATGARSEERRVGKGGYKRWCTCE